MMPKGITATCMVIIFISFSVWCNSQFKHYMEGEEADLNFPYPCDSKRVTLQHGQRTPFYNSSDPGTISLPPEQRNRFFIQNSNQNNQCSLHLHINPVKRNDAFTYISMAYEEDASKTIESVGLDVDFPPGKVSCTMYDEIVVGNWIALNCMAPVGSQLGQIECYQNGERMPPKNEPVESAKYLEQAISVQKTQDPVYCCASLVNQPKGRCECQDFQWDYLHGTMLNINVDPCGYSTSKQEHLVTTRVPRISLFLSTYNPIEIKGTWSSLAIWPYPTIGILLLIVIILSFTLCKCRIKSRNSPRYTTTQRADVDDTEV